MSYLNEAFKELDELVDDVDLQDEDDVKKAIDFLNGDIDNTDHLEMVVDIDAEDEEDLKDNYIGEIILMCPVCHTLHYSTEDDLVHDEEEPDLVNVGDPCPHCKQENGFEIKGKVAEYVPEGEEPKKEDEEEDSEEIFDLEDVEDEETEEEKAKIEESFKLRKKYIETISEDNLDDLARFTGIELPTTKRVVESKSKSLKESKLVEKPVYDLNTEYDSRNSFYGKAKVDVDNKGGNKLYSYNTLVAEMKDGKPVVYGTYSQTTLRHIKEWLKQNGFKAENSKQIMNDYGAKNESCEEAVTKQDDIDAQADNKKEVAKQEFEKKIDDADADRDDKLEEAHYNNETGIVEPDYFYDIEGIEYIGHGDWADPELAYKGKTYNYYDLEDALYDDFKERVNSGEIVISTEGYEDLPRGSKETQAEEDAFEKFVKDNKDLAYEILDGLSPVEENLQESKKSLKESAYDVYQDILERAKLNIDDGHTDLHDAIMDALDNGLIYTDDEFEVLKDIFSCDDLYTEGGENVRQYIDEKVYNEIYGDVEEYFNSKKEQGEVEESCKKEAIKKAPEITDEQKACKDEECKKKELDESLTVICDFDDYKPWSGAVSTYEKIEEEGKLDDLENLLEECYPEGMTMTAINDILWFDTDWVFESLGITEGEEDDEDEEEDDFDESLFESLVTRYCNRVYENVDTYKATSCSRENGNFIVEGMLTYKNGKQEPTTFTFVENKTNNNTTLYMGINETFSPSKRAFALNVTRDGNKLLSESLRYNYNTKVSNQNYAIKGKVITPKKK